MRAWLVVFLVLAAPIVGAQPVAFSEAERAAILRFGPWPPKLAPDPRNAVSGRREAIALGEALFFDPELSGTGSVLCATCHVPYRKWQDGHARAFGLEETDLNTPSVLNVGFYKRFGWAGKNDALWKQSIRPLLEPREMRSSAARVAAAVRASHAAQYEKAFLHALADDDAILADVGRALAAFQETLVTGRTPFDEFRDALERDDAAALARYPEAAQRGLRLFIGKGGCTGCHSGPGFTNSELVGGFRVPGLRNASLTAPYMHDGGVATLRDAVGHRFALAHEETDALVAFLETLAECELSPAGDGTCSQPKR
jgi:cytochrome c peroxidase